MSSTMEHPPLVEELVEKLDAAVEASCPNVCTGAVKAALEEIVGRDEPLLAEPMMAPAPERYARRLLHRDPRGRYSVVIMTWGTGQMTPVHDHAGMWCVECVYRGRIAVTSFSLEGPGDTDEVTLHPEKTVAAGIGEAGALIPPFEYHRIANPNADTAVTIHVYSGDMTWCNRFVPETEGTDRYRKTRCDLSFDD